MMLPVRTGILFDNFTKRKFFQSHPRRKEKPATSNFLKFLIVSLILLANSAFLLAQNPNHKDDFKVADSFKKDFVNKMKKLGADEAKRSVLKFNQAKDVLKQERLVEELRQTMLKAKISLKHGIDTNAIYNELTDVINWHKTAGDGIFVNKGTTQTYRNLTTASKIIDELSARMLLRKKQVDKAEHDLVNFSFQIDSLYSNPVLYNFPDDSVSTMEYLKKLAVVSAEIGPIDSALRKSVSSVREVQIRIDIEVNKLNASNVEIENYQRKLSSKMFDRELPNLNDKSKYSRPFFDILKFSKDKGWLILAFYLKNNSGKVAFLLLLIAAAGVFLNSLKKMIVRADLLNQDYKGQLVFRYPILSAVIIIISIFQFIFINQPFILNAIVWVISAICLTIIFKGFIKRGWMNFWVSMLILFLLTCFDNLILQASRPERWIMLVLALSGILSGIVTLIKGDRNELKEKLIIYFIAILIVLETFSVLANSLGRYNLAKTLLVGGYINLIIGILFLWTVRLMNEALFFASKVYTTQDRKLFYVNFNAVGEKVPSLFYLFLIVGWFILFGRNFYVFRLVFDPLKQFFTDERTIGNYSFTIINVLLFFVIIGLSVVTSKIVSFFATDKNELVKGKKITIGSWLLLIRVTIISLGLFLALAAAGFPLERITIILGALGVGIGLGLQTIVNNLVSGLIIAFERPVNVGDVVEIGGHTGTMKSIGFRSSVITRREGADLVIPNGDILNAHLVNWTLGGSKKQIELIMGVAYGTDLNLARQIIVDLLNADERIHKHPNPAVFFNQFGESSIEIKLLYWVRDMRDGLPSKSDLILSIDSAFKSASIQIPFPQHDIHLYTQHETPNKTVKKEKPTDKI